MLSHTGFFCFQKKRFSKSAPVSLTPTPVVETPTTISKNVPATSAPTTNATSTPDTIVIDPKYYEFTANNTILIIRETECFEVCHEFSAIIDLRNFNSPLKFQCKTCLPYKSLVATVAQTGSAEAFEVRMKADETHHYECVPKTYAEVMNLHRVIVKIETGYELLNFFSIF